MEANIEDRKRTKIVLIFALILCIIVLYDLRMRRYNLFLDDEYCIEKFLEETSNDGHSYWNVTVGPVVKSKDQPSNGVLIRVISANTEWQGKSVYYPYAGYIRSDLKIFYSRLD